MKELLKDIYQDLASGKLSQQQALEKIRLLKTKPAVITHLLAHPQWRSEGVAGGAEAAISQHHIL